MVYLPTLLKDKHRLQIFFLLSLVTLLGSGLVFILAEWSEKKALTTAEKNARSLLLYQSSNLMANLNKFSVIAVSVSKRPDVIEIFRSHKPTSNLIHAKKLASITAGITGARDFWLVNKNGSIFSSSDASQEGLNISDEAYFESGFQGRLGRASVVDQDNRRSYIFAAPVFVDQKVNGLVVIRVNLETIEYAWALLTEPMLATESGGRVLLTNIKNWRLNRFASLLENSRPLAKPNKNQAEQTNNPDNRSTIDDSYSSEFSHYSQEANLITLKKTINGSNSHHYIEVTTYIPLLEWTLHVLTDLSPIKQQRYTTMIISALLLALLILSLWILFQRRRQLIERNRYQTAFASKLEKQVLDRTLELTTTNEKLKQQVSERIAAETALRETQEDLLQAAKLAGIGQMSAALAHEYNQPLAAIRSYSDNALQLLSLQKVGDVEDNLLRISRITERMADLTKTLRSFAHKPKAGLEPVTLSTVMDEIIILLSPQAKKQGVELRIVPSEEPAKVIAGHIRLSQVIMNLITNAMDALETANQKCVEVSWKILDEQVEILVKDTGPGISEALQEKIFTPFFTTKTAGTGLGLGLFIVYNIIKEFNGTIELQSQTGYGAVFSIKLPLAK